MRKNNTGQTKYKSIICGLDEVGRGCIFGPVYASCVTFATRNIDLSYLSDSKALTEEAREGCFLRLSKEENCIYTVGLASALEIDRYNIHHASLLAMKRALLRMTNALCASHYLALVDGKFSPLNNVQDDSITESIDTELISSEAVIKGDTIIPEIQAASIVAKVLRDASMRDYDALFPHYKLKKNKGYPTQSHKQALSFYGPSPLHRFSFAPLRAL